MATNKPPNIPADISDTPPDNLDTEAAWRASIRPFEANRHKPKISTNARHKRSAHTGKLRTKR